MTEHASPATDPRLSALADRFLDQPDVAAGTGFGSGRGLRVGGRIFAIFGEAALTVKLPRSRVAALLEAGIGARFDPGTGRLMQEWLTVDSAHATEWEALAEEALTYVRGRGTTSSPRPATRSAPPDPPRASHAPRPRAR